jgi:hypothetical protein
MIKRYNQFINESNESLPPIPEKYWGAIEELGDNPTPQDVILLWSDLFEMADQLVGYRNGKFLFDTGEEQDPIAVYANIHSYVSEEEFDM